MPSGGMCKRPFGGNVRLDRIDFMDYARGSDDPFKLLYLKVISDAASDFLFFGLGKNGCVAQEFWFAHEYFFQCRSYDPTTYEHSRYLRNSYVDEDLKCRVTKEIALTDNELKLSCFDRHFVTAGLDSFISFDQFLVWLRERRQQILEESKEQVNTYLDLLQATSLRRVPNSQVPYKLNTLDRFKILTQPESAEQVGELVKYLPHNMQQVVLPAQAKFHVRSYPTVRWTARRPPPVSLGQTTFTLVPIGTTCSL